MSEPGSYASTQISDVFFAATHTFDHLTNLALQLNRIDKQIDLFDEPCSMDTINASVRNFTQGLENASKLRQTALMKPYSAQPRRPSSFHSIGRVPVTSDITRNINIKHQSYRLMPATGLNTIQNGNLIRQNGIGVLRKRPVNVVEHNGVVPNKQVRGLKWISVDGSQGQAPHYARNQSGPKVNVRREYTVTPFRSGMEPQRFLVKKELFHSQNVTAISLDDLKPKPPLNPQPVVTPQQHLQLPVLRKPTVQVRPLTEEDAAVSSLLNTLQQPDSEMSGTE